MSYSSLSWKVVVAIVLLVAAGAVLVFNWPGGRAGQIPVRIDRWLACSHCRTYYRGYLRQYPDQCRVCGRMTLWPARRCENGHVVAMDMHGFDRLRKDPFCRQCGSQKLQGIPLQAELPPPPADRAGPNPPADRRTAP